MDKTALASSGCLRTEWVSILPSPPADSCTKIPNTGDGGRGGGEALTLNAPEPRYSIHDLAN